MYLKYIVSLENDKLSTYYKMNVKLLSRVKQLEKKNTKEYKIKNDV